MSGGVIATAMAGETLDALLWRTIGTIAVEPVLAANPGLAEVGPILPEGRAVLIPDTAAAPTATVPLVQLWD